MKTTENFTSKGLVYGSLWGGGKGTYPAINLEGKTKKELIEKSVQLLKNEDWVKEIIDLILNFECS
ncbi:hypothetical protein LCGC14_0873190 [marine sediment metagenome]|uniref:Uncharacterized protein n=1 Tax=marine sediment metagenome TaxID=412755 RepID=A0A0F9RNP3_9ZZZZ